MTVKNKILFFSGLMMILGLAGCMGSTARVPESYPAPLLEADWIRNGEPLEFENESWNPVDNLENLLDNEVLPLGVYRGVQFFVEKEDIKPYQRLYTKFGSHKYRVFEKSHKR